MGALCGSRNSNSLRVNAIVSLRFTARGSLSVSPKAQPPDLLPQLVFVAACGRELGHRPQALVMGPAADQQQNNPRRKGTRAAHLAVRRARGEDRTPILCGGVSESFIPSASGGGRAYPV